jgi:hypothetical protein
MRNERKSSYSAACGNCAVVGEHNGGVVVMDSQEANNRLPFSADVWSRFLKDAKGGNFNTSSIGSRSKPVR